MPVVHPRSLPGPEFSVTPPAYIWNPEVDWLTVEGGNACEVNGAGWTTITIDDRGAARTDGTSGTYIDLGSLGTPGAYTATVRLITGPVVANGPWRYIGALGSGGGNITACAALYAQDGEWKVLDGNNSAATWGRATVTSPTPQPNTRTTISYRFTPGVGYRILIDGVVATISTTGDVSATGGSGAAFAIGRNGEWNGHYTAATYQYWAFDTTARSDADMDAIHDAVRTFYS